MSADVPHFALPFRFTSPHAAVVEQDSIDEIADCVLAVMLCPYGYRVELPEFGLPDPVFSTPHVDVVQMRQAVELWEPRAALVLQEHPDLADALISHVETLVRVRTEE